MQSVKKAPDEAKTNDYDELNQYGQEFYREATARKNIIEQILIDCIGYYPKRIDNKIFRSFTFKNTLRLKLYSFKLTF